MKITSLLIIASLTLVLMANGVSANKFVFIEGASQTLDAGAVSAKITVQRQTNSGTPITSSALNNIILSTPSTGGSFYSNAAGTNQINHIDMPNGVSTASFYYRDSAGGNPTLKASYTGWTPATTTFTINANKLVFIAGASQNLDAGVVSTKITVQRQTYSSTPITSSSLNNIILSTKSTGGMFYSNAAGTNQINHIDMPNGVSTASFYYRDSAGGNPTLKASHSGWTPATTTFTIYANKLVFTAGASQNLDAGVVSTKITVERQRDSGAPITSPSMNNIILSTSSTGGNFYSNAAGTILINHIDITNGASTAIFYYMDVVGGTPTLTASYKGWTPATTLFTINTNKLVFTGGASQTLGAGVVSTIITVQRQKDSGAPITSSALNNIILSTSSTGGNFYSNAVGTTQINHIDISNGASTAIFYYRDAVGGTPTLTASYKGWTPATSIFTIIPNKFVFTAGASQTLDAGVVSTKITVQRQTNSSTPITSPALNNVILSTSSTGGKFYSNAVGTTQINQIDIANGASTASFYYKDTVDGNPTLMASYTGWTPGTTTFTIDSALAKKLAFIVQPGSTTAGLSITPEVQVEVQDKYGNRVTASNSPITILIGNNPGGGTLLGGGPLNAVNGVATFSTLSVNKDGLGYTLKTSSPGLTGATSGTFNIIPVYTHSITNATGGNTYTVGSTATDTVTSSSILGRTMTFTWIRPDTSTARAATRTRNVNYMDTNSVDIDGTWTINVKERKSGNIQIGDSTTSFSVVSAPEFGKLGALFPLLAIGFIFMNMRKKTLKK